MPRERQIRVYGAQREDIDIDLMTQIVIQMGRQLAQETMTDEAAPVPSITIAPGAELAGGGAEASS